LNKCKLKIVDSCNAVTLEVCIVDFAVKIAVPY